MYESLSSKAKRAKQIERVLPSPVKLRFTSAGTFPVKSFLESPRDTRFDISAILVGIEPESMLLSSINDSVDPNKNKNHT